MFGTLRRFGPVGLIPAAWVAAGAATVGSLQREGMLIAHLVMVAFIAFFLVTGWNRMDRGALRAWRAVLVAGLGLTLAGVAGFVGPGSGPTLLAVSLVGWMVLPAVGLAYTARELPDAVFVYAGGAAAAATASALASGIAAAFASIASAIASSASFRVDSERFASASAADCASVIFVSADRSAVVWSVIRVR